MGMEKQFLPGLVQELVYTVDHKKLGMMYLGSGLVFFVLAGIMAAAIRVQLAVPNNHFLNPGTFNRFFTMHGTTMVFLVGMPLILGLANYLVPIMIGTRDMAFPRLNAFGFWIFFFSGFLLFFSYLGGSGVYGTGSAPDVGWFAYSPLTAKAFSRGHSTDYWTLSLLAGGIGSVATAINLLATIFCLRCRGMTLNRMPLFVWLNAVVAFLIILAMPPLSACQIMLCLDRYLGAKFFDTQAGGSAILWQHFFWIFGHPEVYILILPAFAIVSEIIPVFSRKPIFGYPVMVMASVMIAFISLGVWIAFLFQFLIAGLTGVMLATTPFDWQLNDSYFVIAHFHYVLVGGLLFSIFAAFYYWYPKMIGRMLDGTMGRWHFWLFLVGFHLTFFPQHIMGILGMPRRIYSYPADRGWEAGNLLSSVGVVFQAMGILVFLTNLFYSYYRGKKAGDDPWDAWTLEWATTSPPAEYNFEKLPEVRSARPLWDLKHPDEPDWKHN
ncbi:MAG: cbb3-type cytochrome c oxidase subunit I [Candidatus Xiphinematobacter sp.]|nr:MAG: cbb3-type cytochrome c oxidase subunit I [Candidatus Xiphinematobacter sp.]